MELQKLNEFFLHITKAMEQMSAPVKQTSAPVNKWDQIGNMKRRKFHLLPVNRLTNWSKFIWKLIKINRKRVLMYRKSNKLPKEWVLSFKIIKEFSTHLHLVSAGWRLPGNHTSRGSVPRTYSENEGHAWITKTTINPRGHYGTGNGQDRMTTSCESFVFHRPSNPCTKVQKSVEWPFGISRFNQLRQAPMTIVTGAKEFLSLVRLTMLLPNYTILDFWIL